MKLSEYCAICAEKLRNNRNYSAFIEIRYYEMSKLFPHKPFSVDQGTDDFFEITLDYLNGAEFPEYTSEYHTNYFNWIKKYR